MFICWVVILHGRYSCNGILRNSDATAVINHCFIHQHTQRRFAFIAVSFRFVLCFIVGEVSVSCI